MELKRTRSGSYFLRDHKMILAKMSVSLYCEPKALIVSLGAPQSFYDK